MHRPDHPIGPWGTSPEVPYSLPLSAFTRGGIGSTIGTGLGPHTGPGIQGIAGRFTPGFTPKRFAASEADLYQIRDRGRQRLEELLRRAREDKKRRGTQPDWRQQGGRVSESERRQRAQEQTRMAQNMRNRQGPRMYAADWMQEIVDKIKAARLQQDRLEDRKGAPNLANTPARPNWTPEEQATAADYMDRKGTHYRWPDDDQDGFGNRLKEYMTPSEFERYVINQSYGTPTTGAPPYLATPLPPEYPISHYMVENPDFGWDDVLRVPSWATSPFSLRWADDGDAILKTGLGPPEWPFQVVPTSEYDVNVGGTPIWPPQQWNRLAPDMWQYLRTGGFPIG